MEFLIGFLCGILIGAIGIIVMSFWVVPDDEDLHGDRVPDTRRD